MAQKIAALACFFLISAMLEAAPEDVWQIVDASDQPLTLLTIDFGEHTARGITSEVFASKKYRLKLVRKDGVRVDAGVLSGRSSKCMVGQRVVEGVKVLMNSKEMLSLTEAARGFDLEVQIRPSGATGAVSCSDVEVRIHQ